MRLRMINQKPEHGDMIARCTSCNALFNFKAIRGSKLKDHRCKCGGEYQFIAYCGGDLYHNRKGEKFKVDFKNSIVTPQP
jgi:hypothetical protein